jgi:TolB-like protein/class 3 adenylate cyclase/Tfp pilus assembly protein PilF
MSQEEQRKLAAIMFTDMVGYSALSQRDDTLALELLEEHRELLREIFPRFHGTEIKTIGDAFLVEFNSALEAAQCGIEIQRTLAKRNADAPAERQIELKIGIHIGDVVHRGGDVYGDGVNIASRIEPLAGAGGICVSMDVERQIRNAVDTRFEKLAPTELKNISVPMELFRIVLPWQKRALAAAAAGTASEARSNKNIWMAAGVMLLVLLGIGWWWTTRPNKIVVSSRPQDGPSFDKLRTASASPNTEGVPLHGESATGTRPSIPKKSIAVLPFDNLSDDKSNAFFAEGVQDEILTRLAKVADLKVIARTSTQKFQSAPENLSDIAKQLGVLNILEGSVQKVNDQVRVNVQLINALTSAHIWAEIYDRKLTDIFAVESDIAKAIAEALQAKLTGSEKAMMSAQPTSDTTAYELYLKGRSLWDKRSGDNIPKAIAFYEQAIARDPNYALAYAGLANAYILSPFWAGADRLDAYGKAEDAALKALHLDANLAEAHLALGKVYFWKINVAAALREYQRAIELKPNDAGAHHWYGNDALAALGRFDQAVAEGKRAVELDPLSVVINADLGTTFYYAHRFDESARQLRKTLEIDPTSFYAHFNLGIALQAKGDLSGAIAEYEKAKQLDNNTFVLTLCAQAKAQAGDKDAAVQMLGELDKISQSREVLGYNRALLYLSLNNKNETLRWLEQGFEERDGSNLSYINVDPLLAPLHGDPRFEALVQKVLGEK